MTSRSLNSDDVTELRDEFNADIHTTVNADVHGADGVSTPTLIHRHLMLRPVNGTSTPIEIPAADRPSSVTSNLSRTSSTATDRPPSRPWKIASPPGSPQSTILPMTCKCCNGRFVDPRILPCFHTFCSKCLHSALQQRASSPPSEHRRHHSSSRPILRCPTCYHEVALGRDGIAGLKKDYFADTTSQTERLMRSSSVDASGKRQLVCDVCNLASRNELYDTEDGNCKDDDDAKTAVSSESGTGRPAVVYCTACRQALCDLCVGQHVSGSDGRQGSHNLVGVVKASGSTTSGPGELQRDDVASLTVRYCETHSTEQADIYCRRCEALVCKSCFIASHNGHPSSTVVDMVDTFRRRILRDVERVAESMALDRNHLELLAEERDRFVDNVDRIEKDLKDQRDKLIARVNAKYDELLKQLMQHKLNHVEQLENGRLELEQSLGLKQRFTDYANQVRETGTPADIAGTAGELQVQTNNILTNVGGGEKRTLQSTSVLYRKFDLPMKNLIGILKLKEGSKTVKTLRRRKQCGGSTQTIGPSTELQQQPQQQQQQAESTVTKL